MSDNKWRIRKVLSTLEMPDEVFFSFDEVIRLWGIHNKDMLYIGWSISDLDFEKNEPSSSDLNVMNVDSWIVEQGVEDISDATILIKYED